MKNQLALLLFFLFIIISFKSNAQQTCQTIQIKSKHAIFKGLNNKEIDQKLFFELAKNPIYSIYIQILNDSTVVNTLDTSLLYKKLNTKFNFLEFKDINNEVVKVQNNQPLVINFWSITCKPCIEEIDSLNLLVKKYPQIKFIAITYDSTSKVKSFINRRKFLYTIVPEYSKIINFYSITTFPTHFFISNKGIIKKIIVGKFDAEFVHSIEDLEE